MGIDRTVVEPRTKIGRNRGSPLFGKPASGKGKGKFL